MICGKVELWIIIFAVRNVGRRRIDGGENDGDGDEHAAIRTFLSFFFPAVTVIHNSLRHSHTTNMIKVCLHTDSSP